jgi:hypothetical protein
LIAEQLPAAVGVSMMVGITRTSGVGVIFVSDEQALRMKIHALKINIKKVRFMGFSLVGQAFSLTLASKTIGGLQTRPTDLPLSAIVQILSSMKCG